MQPAIFLDRDNTLIHNDGDLGDPAQVRLIDGVPRSLRALREAGFHLIVVTNQAGVGRGRFTEDDVDAVHQRIAMLVDEHAQSPGLIDRFYYCPYHPEATVREYCRDHPWRKPNPGMLLQAARDLGLDLSRSWMIGDQERDILAGRAAGCRTALVSRDADLAARVRPTVVAGDFATAVQTLLQQSQPPGAVHAPGSGSAAAGAPAASMHMMAGSAAPGQGAAGGSPQMDVNQLRRAMMELAEEIRSDRARRSEFTLLKMGAGVSQLLAVALAVLGLLQVSNDGLFLKWMIGAALAQLFTISLLLVDLKG